MQIRILAVGQRAPRWVDEAVDDYLKRFPRELSVELLAVRTETRTGPYPLHRGGHRHADGP